MAGATWPTMLRRLWRRRWLRFLLLGVVNTAFSYAVYALLLALGLHYALANLGALALGIVFSFRTHSAYVFGHPGWRPFARYVLCWVAIYCLNILMIAGLVRAGADPYTAGALTVLPGAAMSYLAQRYVVFRSAGPSRAGGPGRFKI